MALDHYTYAYYCKKCEAILMHWDEEVVEVNARTRFFAQDGILETGDSKFLDELLSHKKNKVICRTCRSNVKHMVTIKDELFQPILKHVYRNEEMPDDMFRIDLKPSTITKRVMLPPTLQEIKEAITVDLI
jgi:hypothetical protein